MSEAKLLRPGRIYLPRDAVTVPFSAVEEVAELRWKVNVQNRKILNLSAKIKRLEAENEVLRDEGRPGQQP